MLPEITEYLGMIKDLRGQVVDLLREMPAEALNWRPIEGDNHVTNSLAVLAVHLAGAEHFWIAEVVGEMPATRNRPAEFLTEVASVEPLLTRLTEVGEETGRILPALTESQLNQTRLIHGRPEAVSTRWAILHVIDHTALHLGHMQITAQLWGNGKAMPSPRWFQRVVS